MTNVASPKVAYLVNQYPKLNHSFIRREIQAIEATGIKVVRFSIREPEGTLLEQADIAEKAATRVILNTGISGLLLATIKLVFTHPLNWLRALLLAFKLGYRSDRGLLLHLIYLAESGVLYQWLQTENIKHLHAHFATNSTAVALLCNKLGGPGYSFTAHGSAEFDRLPSIGIALKLKYARFVAAISLYGRSQLYRYCPPEQWPKLKIIRCGIDETFLDYELLPVSAPPNFVCVGRLSAEKGQLVLLAAARLLNAENHQFTITLIGDGELHDLLKTKIAEYGLQHCVKLAGWADSNAVRHAMRSSRALIVPSLMEGLPVVIMEAFALGRPVISSTVAGIPELVQHEINGWLVTPGSAKDLAAAMQQVLNTTPNQLTEMGRAGRKRVQQQHQIRIEAEKLAGEFLNYI